MATNETALAKVRAGRNSGYAGSPTGKSEVSREVLEDRWHGAIGLELVDVLGRFVLRVTRNQGANIETVDHCIEAIHRTIIDEVASLGIAKA